MVPVLHKHQLHVVISLIALVKQVLYLYGKKAYIILAFMAEAAFH